MNYQTFKPHTDLEAVIKCHWVLEVPAQADPQKQRIIPDGCIEMFFILGDDVKRYTGSSDEQDDFVIQPRAMVLGQITKPLFIEPTGYVNSFAVRFYPYGFANFVQIPIRELANKETPLTMLFGEKLAKDLEQKIADASAVEQRIEIVESFLLTRLKDQSIIDSIVKDTVDSLFRTKGGTSIQTILKDELSKRRSLERKFLKQVGMSPKQLSKVIRIQTALKTLLNEQSKSLTKIAYESEYYDQAHFIKDFKEFTGINPKEYLSDEKMVLSSLFYAE